MHVEFEQILRYWWDRGVAGFRIDVANALVKDRELRDGDEYMRERPEVHAIYERWQEIAREYDPKPTLMGETYVALDKLPAYYRGLDLCQNFRSSRPTSPSSRCGRSSSRRSPSCRPAPSRSGSAPTTTTPDSPPAGPAATSARHAPRSFSC